MEKSAQNDTFETCFKTSVPLYKYKLKWKFENFSGLFPNTKLRTPDFCPIPGQEWHIEFEKEAELWYAYLCSNEVTEVNIVAKTSLSDTEGKTYYNECRSLCEAAKVKLDLIYGFPKKLALELQNLPGDVLVFSCDLKLYNIAKPDVEEYTLQLEDKTDSLQQLLDDLKNLHDSAIHPDVRLRIEGTSIESHKAILCARSPVFARMFEHRMKENIDNVVDIKDVSAVTMKQFIALLYCPVIKDDLDFETLCDLYYTADKYEVGSFQRPLGKKLLHLLQESNSLRLLALAYRHNNECLKTEVMKYVKFHLKSIVNLDSWEEFVIHNGKLASMLMNEYLKELSL